MVDVDAIENNLAKVYEELKMCLFCHAFQKKESSKG